MMFRYRLVRFLMRIIQVSLCTLKVRGRENIPAAGPYLVVLNHMSTADSPLLMIGFPVIRWRFFAGEKWENHPIWGPLMNWVGAIYIDREDVDRGSIREAIDALVEGGVFALAPEGKRSKIGSMREAKSGAAYLAARAGVPILPVGISNSDRIFSGARSFDRQTVMMQIGQPFSLPSLGRRPRGADFDTYTRLIMAHIAVLVDPRHRGVYADDPAVLALLDGRDPWPHCLPAGDTTPPTDNPA